MCIRLYRINTIKQKNIIKNKEMNAGIRSIKYVFIHYNIITLIAKKGEKMNKLRGKNYKYFTRTIKSGEEIVYAQRMKLLKKQQ